MFYGKWVNDLNQKTRKAVLECLVYHYRLQVKLIEQILRLSRTEWFWAPDYKQYYDAFDHVYCVKRGGIDNEYVEYFPHRNRKFFYIPESKYQPTANSLTIINNESPRAQYFKFGHGEKIIIMTKDLGM